jgi:hypothetical protein
MQWQERFRRARAEWTLLTLYEKFEQAVIRGTASCEIVSTANRDQISPSPLRLLNHLSSPCKKPFLLFSGSNRLHELHRLDTHPKSDLAQRNHKRQSQGLAERNTTLARSRALSGRFALGTDIALEKTFPMKGIFAFDR